MKERFVSKAFEIVPGMPDFYRASFGNCVFVLKDAAETSFLLCELDDCVFIPPLYDPDGNIDSGWDDRLVGCTITNPRTQLLLTAAEVDALSVPKIERPCRINKRVPCHTPQRCIFECARQEAS